VTIPLSDLKHEVVNVPLPNQQEGDSIVVTEPKLRISPVAMQDALSVRFSDLKIVSVGHFSDINPSNK
jgi:hypothetical protein